MDYEKSKEIKYKTSKKGPLWNPLTLNRVLRMSFYYRNYPSCATYEANRWIV